MNTIPYTQPCAFPRSAVAAILLLLGTLSLVAQDRSAPHDAEASPALARMSPLPDAPGMSSASSPIDTSAEEPQAAPQPPEANHFAKYIDPGQTAPKLSAFDKVLLGLRHSTSSFAAATWVVSAAYEQAVDSRPNYDQTFKGYTQRLGAAAARNVSDGVFSDSVLAPILHEDPRYYRLGPGRPAHERVVHAVLQPLFTRRDNGANTINFAQIGGNLAGAALTDAYYPSNNRTTGATLVSFGSSMVGGALGYLANEFFPIHLPMAR